MRTRRAFAIAAACGITSSTSLSQVMAEDDPGSLDKLHDIVTPPAISFWPPAPGWYGIALLLAIVLLYALWRCWQHWRANAYRRVALAELTLIERNWRAAPTEGNPVGDMQVLLKRCALAAYPRDLVAGLSGAAWHSFLDQRMGGSSFADGLGAILVQGSYQQAAIKPAAVKALLTACRLWIKRHRPLPQQTGPQQSNEPALRDAAPIAKAG